ncbi:hypothetical protein GCK72_009198 [Caenorhabditis remanei]|uniref:Uncharacterized protein n=1 Tax=Caenorhabditis remanei TaxID=31234 RepID=A0A6A5H1X4_CAERE|nr:hypothetical protein GCK72_009198 [Caenorhabditis remanei]KAF1760945.1 hypothetical protein GCK72_009198 [Caenorhabditis remanei]
MELGSRHDLCWHSSCISRGEAEKSAFFTANPSFQFAGRAARDLSTIQKMTRFWPPHQGYGLGEFSLVYTICLILFMRLIDMPTVTQSVVGTRYNSRIFNFIATPIYTSIIPFILLFPMMRLSEMHIFVLALNFLHILGSCYIVYSVWYFLKSDKTEVEQEKKKVE